MVHQGVDEYLIAQKEGAKTDELSAVWNDLHQLHQSKKWYQLTTRCEELVRDPTFTTSTPLLGFYENFVTEFRHRINPLSLVRIAACVAATMKDYKDAVEFLEKLREVVKTSDQAMLALQTTLAETLMRARKTDGSCSEISKIRSALEDAQQRLDQLPGVTPVHADFYRVHSLYLKEVADYSGYYVEALRYLGCIEVDKALTEEEQVSQAMCLAIAALLGKDVYNFGELLAHPILSSLEKHATLSWLVDLLRGFNAGDVARLEKLKAHWGKYDDLTKNVAELSKKIRLMCLMEMAYVQPSHMRQLKFDEIARRADLPKGEVEYLVMKALSIGIIKGHIDQVAERVTITWVQPRVLDYAQISNVACRLQTWATDVTSLHGALHHEAEEILTQ